MTDTNPTALDWLRYTRARGTHLLDSIDSCLADIAADMDVAVDLIATLKDLLEPRPLPGTPGYYSDGREVWTDVQLDEGAVYVHYWHPDPTHPDNQPQRLRPSTVGSPPSIFPAPGKRSGPKRTQRRHPRLPRRKLAHAQPRLHPVKRPGQ